MKRTLLRTLLLYLALAAVVIGFLFPPAWMVVTSFKLGRDIVTWPPTFIFKPTLENWYWFYFSAEASAMAPQEGRRILREFLPNSLIVAVVTTALSMAVASLCAYAFARFNFRGKRPLAFAVLGTRMLPPIATVIPLFIFMNSLHLRDTLTGLILSYTALNLPLAIWMLWGFIKEVPPELEEAGLVDGCSRTGALIRILFPVIAPGLAATSVFSFLLAWNDFPIALFLVAHKAKTMPLAALGFYAEEGVYWGPMSVYGILYMVPTILFAVFVQRHIVKGLTLGALK
ncbi:MAG: carbohydrate ABC transporter permease [candidate division NC10 bacterium]|nr:carbohydrate ABC transporter permease [candidate division NC10 bacterium]MBI2458381.1 carbohydrate ABC transporter permease [candidate division NC10 bacterium]MBI2918481.1 carbohydrate ABC transporter permease [Chloroflexota bacterium]MBI3084157.1 carbohydrate ABC transporter permease [candidate division NC10 bacterium]